MPPNPLSSNISMNQSIKRIAEKEVTLFFASPIAYMFLATFAIVTLFVFFWGESFFARNIADVRPLFEWMPILLIFLASTLTMRLWSEERRTGTIEYIFTQPAPLWHFVLAKFRGCLFLLALALLITLPIPITVSIVGDLDWGPVISGYIAAFFLGAAYLSIGLFVSARSNNQIVSLIGSVALCGVFYLLGSTVITDFTGNRVGELLRLIGTGSRFDSITRGVIDLRDIYYYLSIICVFIVLNTLVLERERWTNKKISNNIRQHHRSWKTVSLLLVVNLIVGNMWLSQVHSLRIDTTEGGQYSISDATQNYIAQLQEPLLIRGYFSEKTHPLLAPLVPQLRDLIREYEVSGKGRIRSEFLDPTSDATIEQDAAEKYGIQPTPFQIADRYQSAIVSSYFNVLIQYGDQHEVLTFQDLIEVKAKGPSDIDVALRNPEHDLTRAIKKVLNSYQASGNLFDTVRSQLTFNAYVSDNKKLPESLLAFKDIVKDTLDDVAKDSQGNLAVNFIDPDQNNGAVATQIANDYGFKPMATSLFSNEGFFFYLTLQGSEQIVQIPFGDLSEGEFERNLDAAIKRFATGFTKNIALVAPQVNPQLAQQGIVGASFGGVEQFLSSELNVSREDLTDGTVSGEADILLLLAPEALDDKQLFAVDQFLMQGGTVIAATSPYLSNSRNRSLNMTNHNSGMADWFAHHGLTIENKLVMDTQNTPFPVPVPRNVGGFQIQEIHLLDYPYFIDVRGAGLNSDNLITSELQQATMAWASPIVLDAEKNSGRTVTELLRSSDNAWLSDSVDISPRVDSRGNAVYTPQGDMGSQLLGVVSQGQFTSYFAGKNSPLLEETNEEPETSPEENNAESEKEAEQISSVIEKSSTSARIILFSSNDFLRDGVLQTMGATSGGQYLATMQMLANAIDWSLEDEGLLSIRSRGQFNRTLPPMEKSDQQFWEYLNYVLAMVILVTIALVQKQRKSRNNLRILNSIVEA